GWIRTTRAPTRASSTNIIAVSTVRRRTTVNASQAQGTAGAGHEPQAQTLCHMSDVKAVLWDLDGTLVNSEEYHWQSWRDALAPEGLSITYEQFLGSFGMKNDPIMR